jgi:hypothetical protein
MKTNAALRAVAGAVAGVAVLSAGLSVVAEPASADCVRVHVWVDREGEVPTDVYSNPCVVPTPFSELVDLYQDHWQSGVVPHGAPNGVGEDVGVPFVV